MTTTTTRKRSFTPTIHSVYRPIERYQALLVEGGEPRSPCTDEIQPLDAFLIHLLLDFHPLEPTLIDLTADATRGATSILGLTHPRVRRVLANAPNVNDQRSFLQRCWEEWETGSKPTLELFCPPSNGAPWSKALGDTGKGSPLVFLMIAEPGKEEQLVRTVKDVQDAAPEALVAVLGLGRVGQCAAVEALVGACGSATGRRLILLRELSAMLGSSRLGIVASKNNAALDETVQRIEHRYTSNYDFLELVKNASLAAIRAAGLDSPILNAYPEGWAVENREKIGSLERALSEARQETTRVREQLTASLDQISALECGMEKTACQNQETLGNLEHALNEARQETTLVREQLAASLDQVSALERALSEARQDTTLVRERLAASLDQVSALERGMEDAARANRRIGSLECALSDARQETTQVRVQLAVSLDRVTALERGMEEAGKQAQALEHFVTDLRNSLAFRVANRASRLRKDLAPPGSARGWLAQKLVRAIRRWRAEGIFCVFRGTARNGSPCQSSEATGPKS